MIAIGFAESSLRRLPDASFGTQWPAPLPRRVSFRVSVSVFCGPPAAVPPDTGWSTCFPLAGDSVFPAQRAFARLFCHHSFYKFLSHLAYLPFFPRHSGFLLLALSLPVSYKPCYQTKHDIRPYTNSVALQIFPKTGFPWYRQNKAWHFISYTIELI